MSWWWPFKKNHVQEASHAEFKRMLEESHTRSTDLEAVADKLRENRENIHKRTEQILGEKNVVAARQARHSLKSQPG